jgi:uncharacterized damage-inducible protein DinB
MHHTEDFLKVWEMESASTLKVFDALTDASLSQSVVPGGYTLQSLAWHITTAAAMLPAQGGLVSAPERGPAPATVAEIIAVYRKNSAALVEAVRERSSDAAFAENINFFGRPMRRGVLLSFTIMHQAHHRAQMTVLMKQAGLKVPGVYGPSEDDQKAAKK